MEIEDDEARCRTRAYALWEAAGWPEGCDLEHWTLAQMELDGSLEQVTASQPAIDEAGDAGSRDAKNRTAPG